MSTGKSLRIYLMAPLLGGMAAGMLITFLATLYLLGDGLPAGAKGPLYAFHGLFALVWLSLMALLLSLLLRRPTRQLALLAEYAEDMGRGRLPVLTAMTGVGEIGKLSVAMSSMAGSLNQTLNGIIVAANRLFSSEAKLDDNAGKFADNARRQSERAQELAVAAEEMSQTIDEIAGSAAVASQTSSGAAGVVEEGKAVAAGAVLTARKVLGSTSELAGSFCKLNASIVEIGEFVDVIGEIADQTNLLALNAAIEAARSGEHGRGFAVVADEVRNLASRTIRSTGEISAKIRAVQRESAQTATLVEEASADVNRTRESIERVGESLDQILEAFATVNDHVARTATAVEEQSATTHEVAAGIENSSALSAEMGEMAGEVAREVTTLAAITDELLVALGTLRLEAHRKTERLIEELAGDRELLSADRAGREAFMRRAVRGYPFIELLYITDENGRQVTSNISATEGLAASYGNDGFRMDWSSRPWFKGAMKGRGSFVTDLYRSAATGTFCYTVARTLRDEAGRVRGVLGADIDFQRLCRFDGRL